MSEFNQKDMGNLKDFTVNYIRKLIIEEKKLKQGERINERDIAEALNISRAPVREALNELKEQGLVSSIQYKGWFVAEVNKEDFIEIVELRTLLQYNLLKHVIEGGGPEPIDIENLKSLNNQMKYIIESDQPLDKKVYKFCIKEIEFHTYLCETARNNYKWTQRIHKNLSYQIVSSLEKFFNEEYKLVRSVISHDELIEALVNKDLGRLSEIMQEKVQKVEE